MAGGQMGEASKTEIKTTIDKGTQEAIATFTHLRKVITEYPNIARVDEMGYHHYEATPHGEWFSVSHFMPIRERLMKEEHVAFSFGGKIDEQGRSLEALYLSPRTKDHHPSGKRFLIIIEKSPPNLSKARFFNLTLKEHKKPGLMTTLDVEELNEGPLYDECIGYLQGIRAGVNWVEPGSLDDKLRPRNPLELARSVLERKPGDFPKEVSAFDFFDSF